MVSSRLHEWSSVHSFIHSFIHLFIHSLIHSFIYLTSVRKIIRRKLQIYFVINNGHEAIMKVAVAYYINHQWSEVWMNYYNMSVFTTVFCFHFPWLSSEFLFSSFFSLSLNEKSIGFFLIIGRKFDIKIFFYELFFRIFKA